jgi:AcrR family transcriptional regulator
VTSGKPPSRATARKQAQRERILCAAQACFVEYGFHGASMANIADRAEMSPGLIYRYFDSKNAIILAIIDKQLAVSRMRIRQLHTAEKLSRRVIEYLNEPQAKDDDSINMALYLEISAQGTRDPQISEALQKYDAAVKAELTDWLCRSPEDGGCGLDEDLAPARALMLLSLLEGHKIRGQRKLNLDMERLRNTLDQVLAVILGTTASTSQRAGANHLDRKD